MKSPEEQFANAYMDDLIETWEDHFLHVRMVRIEGSRVVR